MKINPAIIFREEFDGSAVLFDPDSGEAFELSATGAFIWKKISGNLGKDEVLAALAEECENGVPESAGDDYDEFVEALRNKGLVKD